ncbi:MAG: DUF3368 domain-containing protein [Mucilaginibacter sp.]|uniref:DUF3368 domain-containing protein n=1 Tax=Mucilaginibacter sp. TaxID=1882438 RepID=UPI0034E3DFA2
MRKTVIADTSCFILLTNINELDLLHKTYGQIVTTPEIAAEYRIVLPDWVQIVAVSDSGKQQLFELQIDKGESSAIALAIETPDANIILDDYKARKIAMQLGLDVTGTVGVIIKAKLKGIIPSIKPILEKISRTNFRLSEDVENQALKEAKE